MEKAEQGLLADVYVHRSHWLHLERRVLENFWSTSIAWYETALRAQEANVDGTWRELGLQQGLTSAVMSREPVSSGCFCEIARKPAYKPVLVVQLCLY